MKTENLINIEDQIIDFGRFEEEDWHEIEQLALQFQSDGFFKGIAWKCFVGAGIVYLYLKESRLKELQDLDSSTLQ